MNLIVRLFGRELLSITARVDETSEQEPERQGYSIGFAAAELDLNR